MAANRVVAVGELLALECAPLANGCCAKAVVHRTEAAETNVFRVDPGGALANHYHTKVWDLFFGVAGAGEIVFDGGGESGRVAMRPGSFCAIPPGVRHEVRNASRSEEFVYVLVHAPGQGYDHIPAPLTPVREKA